MECVICYETFDLNNLDLIPVSLNCGHTFCRKCLLSISNNKKECPLDKITIEKNIVDLKPNFALMDLIEKMNKGKIENKPEEFKEDQNEKSELYCPLGHELIQNNFEKKSDNVCYICKTSIIESSFQCNSCKFYICGECGLYNKNILVKESKILKSITNLSLINTEINEEIEEEDFDTITNSKVLSSWNMFGPYYFGEIEETEFLRDFQIVKFGSIQYKGEMKNGLRNGYGKCKWPDGSIYYGKWSNDKANGKGRIFFRDGDTYIGDWINDKADGEGIYLHADGNQYKGSFMEDKQHGKGIESWPDGSFYEGLYEHGKKNGKGKFIWADGSYYNGEFKNNNIQGYGEKFWKDGRIYKGKWLENKRHSKGIFTWKDGKIYDGYYKNDKKHGFGKFKWLDGQKYIGEWFNGKIHGIGNLISSNDKKCRKGQWDNGKRIKWIDE